MRSSPRRVPTGGFTARRRYGLARDSRTSDYALEGTCAHALAEYKLRKALGYPAARDPTEDLAFYNEEMEEATDGYVAYVLEKVEAARQACPDPVVLVEQRVDYSRWVRQGFGTSDAVVIADGTLRIIDLKYGTGIAVSTEDNPQLKCYSLGALELFDDIYDIDSVAMSIYQPRRQNVSEWQISKKDLLAWADEVLKLTAELAWDGKGEFSCGPWCRFCKAKTICRAGTYQSHDFLDTHSVLTVSGKTMADAIRLGRYFLNHAQAAYSVLPEDAMYRNADMILQRIKERKLTAFDRRAAMRICRTFKTVDSIQPVLDFLEDYGYIAQKPQKYSGTGRPPFPKYAVNPRFYEK